MKIVFKNISIRNITKDKGQKSIINSLLHNKVFEKYNQ